MGICRFVVPVAALLTLTACGGGAGGTSKQATLDCQGSTKCTVTYPAKARNNQSSSGGPPAEVLGVQTQLFSIAGGMANFRIADTPVSLEQGEKKKVGNLSVQAVEVTSTSAVLTYTKS